MPNFEGSAQTPERPSNREGKEGSKERSRASIVVDEDFDVPLAAAEKIPKHEVYLKPTGDPERPFDKDKGTPVTVLEERWITRGQYGSIYEAALEIQGQDGRAKRYGGVIKDYSESSMISGTENGKYQRAHCENVLKKHRALQDAGIPVFRTFRLEKDKPRILMTNGNSDETVLVNVWNRGTTHLEDFGEKKLDDITNFEEWSAALFDIIEASAGNGVHLDEDSPFFIVDKKTHGVRTIIGDLDRVSIDKTAEMKKSFEKVNRETAGDTLIGAGLKFIRNNVKEEMIKPLQDRLRAMLQEHDKRNGIIRRD